MCDVMSGVMAAMAVASAAIGAVENDAASKYRNAQVKASDEANLYNANQIIKEQTTLSDQEGIKQQQERKDIADKRLEIKKSNMEDKSSFQAVSNAEGNAYNSVMSSYDRVNGNNMNAMDQQLAMLNIGHNIARRGYKDSANSKIGSMSGYIIPGNTNTLKNVNSILQIGKEVIGSSGKSFKRGK